MLCTPKNQNQNAIAPIAIMERHQKVANMKDVVSRTYWTTLLQKAPPELAAKAKSQEDDLEREDTSQGFVSLQYVLEAASLSGGARALSSRLNSLAIELETSVVNPVLSVRLDDDLKPFIIKLLNQERELKLGRTDTVQLREAVEVLLNVLKVDFQNKLSEIGYHTRVRSLLNSVLFLLRVPGEVRVLRGSKTDNFSNFLEISEMIESASKILSQAEFISCDGLDQVRGEVVKLAEDIAHEMIELLHEELFLGDTDLSSLLVEFSRNDELLKERLMNLLNGLYRLQYSSVSGSYCNSNYQQQLVALMERCIAEARELYLRRSPVARIEDEPRGYDLLSRSDLIPSFPILWRDLAEEDSRRIDIFVKVLTSAFLEVLRRFRLVKDSISKLEDEDTYPTSRTVWLWMQRIVVVELGYMLETEFPDIEYHDSANALYSPMNSLHLRPKGLRERFEQKIAKSHPKTNVLHNPDHKKSMIHSHSGLSLESNYSENNSTEGQLASLANQTCYWLGIQPNVLWTPVVYNAIILFNDNGGALALDDEQPVHQLVDSYSHRAAKGGSKDDTLFVFLEGFLKNHFCKVAAEKIDHETRRLCSESDSFTTEEPPPEVLENILEDHASSFVAVMRRLCRLKLLDSYRTGCYKIFKCCYEACYIIEEAYSLESLLKESFQASGIFNLLMSPFCTRFGDTFFQIIKALLIPLWNEDTFEWLVHHCLEKLDVMELRGIVGTTTSQLGIDTLRMLIIVYNSTCFLLEPLRMRRKEIRVYDSAEVSDDSSLLAQLNKITNICMKIFAIECINLIEISQRSCQDTSEKISCCSAKFLEQQYAYFFEVAKQCRDPSLLSNISGLIHDYATMLLLNSCNCLEKPIEEVSSTTTA